MMSVLLCLIGILGVCGGIALILGLFIDKTARDASEKVGASFFCLVALVMLGLITLILVAVGVGFSVLVGLVS